MFMHKYHRLNPALRDLAVVNRLLAAWKAVWLKARKGAWRQKAVTMYQMAQSPNQSRLKVTSTMKARMTSIASWLMSIDLRMPSQSETSPEKNRQIVVPLPKIVKIPPAS